MTKSTGFHSVLKALTFLPIGVSLYFFDFGRWYSEISGSHFIGLFLAGIILFALGVFLKRRIISTYVEQGISSYALGSISLALAAIAYLYGSFYQIGPWLHFESLILLVISYISFRFDSRIVRLMFPLFVVLSLSYGPSTLESILGAHLYVVAIDALLLLFYLLFVNTNLRSMIFPVAALAIATIYFLNPSEIILLVFIPALAFVYAPRRLRTLLSPQPRGMPPLCSNHTVAESGFCIVCGRKIVSSGRVTSAGSRGLILVALVVVALVLTQIPVLILNGGAPYDGKLSYAGVSTKAIPATPSGWIVNSSSPLNYTGDFFGVKNVYVPMYHPERMNYTLYYELARGSPSLVRSWNTIPGWTKNYRVMQLGPFSGDLVVYNKTNTLMLVYEGVSQAVFLNGTRGTYVQTGVNFVRNFTATNSSVAISEFQNDLSTIWLPVLQTEVSHAAWPAFFDQTITTGNSLKVPFLGVATSALIIWGAYRVKSSESRLEDSLDLVSELDDEDWLMLSALINSPFSGSKTAYEIAVVIEKQAGLKKDILTKTTAFLKRIQTKRLAEERLTERGQEILSTWKVSL